LVLPHALGLGQGSPAAGQGKKKLGDVGGGSETHVLAFARIQRRFLLDALPQIKTAAEGVDQHLAAVGGGMFCCFPRGIAAFLCFFRG
jgi:hypothetical protein